MNKRNADFLLDLYKNGISDHRTQAARTGYSVGKINALRKELAIEGYLSDDCRLTGKAMALLEGGRPKNAVILAAGIGLRMVPLNRELPKGLLPIHGEPLIERLIQQLQAAGVFDITIVVGFMKEQFEYLMDAYGVRLVVNNDYLKKNNLHSLLKAVDLLDNSYILPSDIYFSQNPFSSSELYSWYAVSDSTDPDSYVAMQRDLSLRVKKPAETGPAMIGAAFITSELAPRLRERVRTYCRMGAYYNLPWENVLLEKPVMEIYARIIPAEEWMEINTYEQLREADDETAHMNSNILTLLSEELKTAPSEITDITLLKKGMTNRSFMFTAKGVKYIMRIPGEGSNQLINRQQEYAVYQMLKPYDLTDIVVYASPDTGYKLTVFWEGARVCDPLSPEDVTACMKVLRSFHDMHLITDHTFDLFERIQYYENLLSGTPSVFPDYAETKARVLSLQKVIASVPKQFSLTHIDAVPDNFLFIPGGIRLIDWEYAAMQDPHVDIAMFAVYAMYDRAHVEALIDAYFPEGCANEVRRKVYCYIAACGLLWSNWCEFKRKLGVEFGEYALAQYRFAKEYYRIVMEETVHAEN
jgi:CTP:phosphocholine cytidylyltransferase-like protein/thiamine kinase-like enzyme